MSSNVVLKALGLNVQPNQLEVPDGSLVEAKNVDIRRDNSVQPRRGFKLEGDALPNIDDRLKQLLMYKECILRHTRNLLQFENGVNNDGTRKFSDFSGSYLETQPGLRIKSIETKGNLYFTTSEGIKKISAKTEAGLSTSPGFISNAGGVKAIDVESILDYTPGNQTGFLPEDSAVAYRVVWAKYDANDNLILGAPSERTEVYNHIAPLIAQDFARILGALDSISDPTLSLINDGNYVQSLLLPYAASASELRANTLGLAQKIDEDLLFAGATYTLGGPIFEIDGAGSSLDGTTATIKFNASANTVSDYFQVGSHVNLKGFTVTAGDINGPQVITAVNDLGPSISFASAATGSFTVSGTIESNEYRHITQTGAPGWPVPLSDLVISTNPTFQEQKVIQMTLERILFRLQSEGDKIIDPTLVTDFLNPIDMTTTANVRLIINIPDGIGPSDFFQVYRSSIAQASGTTVLYDLSPNDEMQLVYESYPTTDELTNKEITITDITPDAFRGANLYTNEATGEGALAANDVPPFAKDINYFRNCVFYANTRTKHRRLLNLLGVDNILKDFKNGLTPFFTITDGVSSETYTFVPGASEKTEITFLPDVAGSLQGKYFLLNSAYDERQYYVWYSNQTTPSIDPEVPGRIGIRVFIEDNDVASDVRDKTLQTLAIYIGDFLVDADLVNPSLIVVNTQSGPCSDADAGDTGFTVTILEDGQGENAANKEVLLSTAISPAQAVDETARSIIRVINKNAASNVYAYYISGTQSVPGQMVFESKLLTDDKYYIITSSTNVGKSFSPDVSPGLTITDIVQGNRTTNLITTSTPHHLETGEKIIISGTKTVPSIDGVWDIIKVSNVSFRINTNIVTGDSVAPVGVALREVDAEASENEQASNRVYFSKMDQPEAVPIVNYFDVGAADKEILRILPLRDSLFVFKEDGIYRISGELSPFTQALFDNSCILLAPDSLTVLNNELYGWTTQGISKVSEGGVTPGISRPIDTDILKLASYRYKDFKTATFGVGYESENSYLVWTVSETTDEIGTICYRYNTLTQTWTTYDKANTCGIINDKDDKMYLGAGDTNYMEMERKEYERTDYADRELNRYLPESGFFGDTMKLQSVDNIAIGDVIVQYQSVTVDAFNGLIEKINLDLGTEDYTPFMVGPGDDLKVKLLDLAHAMDTDVRLVFSDYEASIATLNGTILSINPGLETEIVTATPHGLVTGRYVTLSSTGTTPSVDGYWRAIVTSPTSFKVGFETLDGSGGMGVWSTDSASFDDLQSCFNIIVSMCNNDTGLTFTNYKTISGTTQIETVVIDVHKSTTRITLKDNLQFVVGPFVQYEAFESSIQYTPQTLGDPLGYKQMYEATVMFENKNFTQAKLGFSTDLLPERIDVPFSGRGNGIFGMKRFGSGFFGGMGGSGPFRTYVPRQCQRCRFINLRFSHKVAREFYTIFGVTLTGNISQSTRPYRG